MTMKKTDLAKGLALKLEGKMKQGVTPDRFTQSASAAADKRERRNRDAAAGLVPFACKLPATLVQQLNDRAAKHEGGVNAFVAEVLQKAVAA